MKYQRLAALRVDNDYTIKALSAKLGLHRDVYSRYERGVRQIPCDIVIQLAQLYDCTTDYILGVSDEHEHFKGAQKDKKNSKKA